MDDLEKKHQHVEDIFRNMGRVIVAYSGGVDSCLLLKIAIDTLGAEHVLAVTADSETYPSRELDDARRFAEEMGARHRVIKTEELAIEGYASNPVNRCYFCRTELFDHLWPVASEEQIDHVVFGVIADDLGDFRPGLAAAREQGIRGPLQEAQFSKKEVRALAKRLGLTAWDKPSFACLSSRFPYGERITVEKLSMVDRAEAFLRELGFRQLRVRQSDQTARIEVPSEEIVRAAQRADEIVSFFKGVGYTYVTLDLQGFRSGSMNEILKTRVRERESQAL